MCVSVCESVCVLSGMFELLFLFVRRSQSDMALMRFLVCELHPQTVSGYIVSEVNGLLFVSEPDNKGTFPKFKMH